jgi:hypothetical protein
MNRKHCLASIFVCAVLSDSLFSSVNVVEELLVSAEIVQRILISVNWTG